MITVSTKVMAGKISYLMMTAFFRLGKLHNGRLDELPNRTRRLRRDNDSFLNRRCRLWLRLLCGRVYELVARRTEQTTITIPKERNPLNEDNEHTNTEANEYDSYTFRFGTMCIE